jgi:transcription initiation factor TFIIIB Brf1 subunit/transcription initiation factor TFIIB
MTSQSLSLKLSRSTTILRLYSRDQKPNQFTTVSTTCTNTPTAHHASRIIHHKSLFLAHETSNKKQISKSASTAVQAQAKRNMRLPAWRTINQKGQSILSFFLFFILRYSAALHMRRSHQLRLETGSFRWEMGQVD